MIPGSANPLLLKSAAAAGGYQVSRSLRFNSSDSAFLSRVPSSSGNTRTWTLSFWIKRTSFDASRSIYSTQYASPSFGFDLRFSSSGNAIDILGHNQSGGNSFNLVTTPVYRDPSAWMHIVLALDTTQATASNRVRLYVNGSEVTQFASASYPVQNDLTEVNSTEGQYIGCLHLNGSPQRFLSAYLGEIIMVDGQQLTPSSFAETNATTGQWVPKAYTGTYGTNGFKLTFSDNSNNTATTLGKDTSGNGNNWTPNNFSVVSGGALQVTFPSSNSPTAVDYLVVGGGGGGGASSGGGGGAGGFLSGSALSVSAGTTYAVEVGAGGLGAAAGASPTAGRSGGTSRFSSIVALGGGGGGSRGSSTAPTTGGSGGGGFGDLVGTSTGAAGTAGQGNAGGSGLNGSGYGSGGGGGAGAVGATATFNQSGAGGAGSSSSITGTSVTYAGGGGGGASANGAVAGGGGTGGGAAGGAYEANGNPASANTGGGGGGAGSTATTNYRAGGNGGSGIVVIRYANTFADLANIGAGLTYTYSNSGGYKIYAFTASVSPADAAGNDSLVDTPTSYGTDTGVGNEVRGNYCTLNPLDASTAITLSNGNLDFSQLGNFVTVARATIALPASGKWYFEYIPTGGPAQGAVGISASNVALSNTTSGNCVFYQENAKRNLNGSVANYGATFTTNDVIGVAHDADSGQVTFYKNNVSQGAISFTSGFSYFPAISPFNVVGNLNFGQRPFAYTAPSGFKALVDTNLPAPVVAKPNTVMDVVLYTGTGAALTPTSSLGFNPDWIWIKSRSAATDHALYDVVRGAQARLESNTTDAEVTTDGGVTAFNSAGFTLGTLAQVNTSSATYAAWCWDAGTTTASNTAGSITSSVRVNATSGFSIVTYTGNSSDNQTIGHGLGAAPAMVIVKRRDAGFGWIVGHTSIGWGNFVQLHSTAASASTPALFANTAPTSTVFSVSVAGNGSTNSNGNTFVAYCFAPVVGYSNGFSYTGDGSTDGVFQYLGFRPRLILLKCSSTTGNWTLVDTSREGYNVDNDPLYPNLSNAEGTTDLLDITSNGFKLRTTDASVNSSGATYIGFAWAEAPFAYSRAR